MTQALRGALLNIRAGEFGIPEPAAEALIDDLVKSQGRSAIVAGPQLPAPCHVLVAALNVTLGNEGTVVIPAIRRFRAVSHPPCRSGPKPPK